MSKTFSRSSNHQVIAGVCAGIAKYFGWQIGLTRLGYLLLSIFSGAFPGVLVYLILWVVLPRD